VWWADLDKRRPVVIASRDDVRGVRQRTTVAAVTSTIRGIPSEVELDERDGLKGRSALNCDELVTIDKSRLVRRIGRLSEARLRDFHRGLAFALALTVADRA
jgi:mRNA interferase MazF